MRKCCAVFVFISCICFFSIQALSQGCISTNNNTVINFSCGQLCGPVNLQVPDLKTSSDYIVSTIPYTPYAFTSATGIQDFIIYDDDKYSTLSGIGFPFCFYDSVFTQVIVGSNGVISFDYEFTTCPPNTSAAWNISNPIPFNSGFTICNPNTSNYPRASIMGAFMDLDPRTSPASSPANRKIEWRTEGDIPCRRFIASYFNIGVFQATACGLSTPATFQIVLYESTGLIEIYIANKICPALGTNGSNAILGIMDWTRTKAVAAPGKNGTAWTAQNESYRFTPSGGASRFINSQLFTLGGTLITTATPANITPGLIDLSFPNICPAGNTEQFVVRTSYTSCSAPGFNIVTDDTITINKTVSLNATVNAVNINCATGATGSITVNVPAGSGVQPYQYSLNGGLLQASNVFTNLNTGAYTVFVTDINGCSSTLNVSIIQSGSFGLGTSVTNSSCPGVNNGTILILPPTIYLPIQYSLNGGPPQTINFFNNLPAGTYIITAIDAVGCTGSTTVVVNQGTGVTASFTTTPTSCSGAINGSITIIPGAGTAPFTYSLNGAAYQPGNVFTGLAAITYTINVRDANGCNTNFPVTINPGAALNATISKTDVICNGANNGTITVNISNGSPPFQYSLDNILWQPGNIFTGLAAGTYTVYYRDINACSNSQSITITQPTILNVSATTLPAVCFGQANGIIRVTVTGGAAPYQYSLDGFTYQTVDSFLVTAGSFVVYVRDINGCVNTQNVIVTQPAILSLSLAMQNASCNGGADGRITATAGGGNGGLQYSIDGGVTYQASNIFNVLPGSYTIIIKDVKNCTVSQSITVGLSNNLSITPAADQTICEGSTAQLGVTTNGNQFIWTQAASLNNAAIQNPIASPTITTQYIVTASFGLCNGQDTIIVNVNLAPVPDAGTDGDICFGQSYQLLGSGGVQYNWTPATSLSSSILSNPLASPPQTITYSLSVVDAIGCPSIIQDQVIINVTPPIIVQTFPSDTVVFNGDQFQLLATSAGTNYTWSPPIGLSNPLIPNPILTVTTDISFMVTATTSAGCRGDGVVNIKVYNGPEIYVPTGFTPNGDGKNDKFKPFPVGITNLNYFKVFNRWGQLVFSTTIFNDGWDGKVGGMDQPTGTFVWMVQGVARDGRVITKRGTVTLIR